AGPIGYARLELNRQLMKQAPKYDRGDMNLRVSALGVWAELVFVHFLQDINVEFDAAPLLDRTPVRSWDFKVSMMGGIDVKGLHPWDASLMVNHEAYNKDKQVD
ncbi:hypothetical protein RZS08_16495, partial [Arthrospira platensis SPKY1]|nr:hypothetical protein [Arthrospira platensis SPKY1]